MQTKAIFKMTIFDGDSTEKSSVLLPSKTITTKIAQSPNIISAQQATKDNFLGDLNENHKVEYRWSK